jgi:prolyl oligopeptidase
MGRMATRARAGPPDKEVTMKRAAFIVSLMIAAGLALASFGAEPAKAVRLPDTPKNPVIDVYHGVKVQDDYRWLENWTDPKVQAWSEAENAFARSYLGALPGREVLAERFKSLLGGASPSFSALTYAGGTLFAAKKQPPRQQPFLVTLPSPEAPGKARVVVDPNAIDPRGITAIDWYRPSPDGKLVAVSLSVGGSEDGTVHIYDVANGKQVYETIARVQEGTGGGDLAWDRNGKGFYYTRYPRGDERPKEDLDFYQQVYHHTLGESPDKDTYCIGKDWPRIAETELKRSDDGAWILATVAYGDGGEYAFYLRGPSGTWQRVADFKDKATHAVFGPGDSLYLLSLKDAPRGKVLRLSLKDPELAKAKVVVPESDAVINGLRPTDSRLYVLDMLGGPSRIRVFDLDGKPLGEVPVAPVSSVLQMVKSGSDDLLFLNQSYLSPPAWYRFGAAKGKVTKTALAQTSPADFSDTEVVRTYAVSKDGTHVPLTLLMRKGTRLDGDNPTLLNGYGGFGVSEVPRFSATRRAWIEQGGIFAIATLRGGGDFGEEWHRAGMLKNKQNVFDDFAACAQALIDKKYTRPGKLAILGGSNGGLLMGAMITQHPGLFKAVVSYVGIYDMLRVELSSNGAFNVTEYGTVKNPEQFKALYAYSPYHHVADGQAYPASLFLTGANDPRVDPMQSRKFVARLQAANGAKTPILLRTSGSSGHGLDMALSERIGEEVDVYAFLFDQLGVVVKPAKGEVTR